MQFSMLSETYFRLTRVLTDYKPGEQRAELFSIYIEAYNGDIIAIASNGRILAAERICRNPHPTNWNFNLVVTPELVTQTEGEIKFAGKIDIIYIPEIKMASLKTQFGFQHPGNALVALDGSHIIREKWRKLPGVPVKESKGALSLRVANLHNLGLASPSGDIVFPAFFDAANPVIVRDRHDPDWLGMFIPHLDEGKGRVTVDPAQLPLWAEIVD